MKGRWIVLIAPIMILLWLASISGNQTSRARVGNPGNYREKTCTIPMRDGKSLSAYISRPDRSGKFSTIYIHTPYRKESAADPLPESPFRGELMGRDRFAYVITDWRGFFGSKTAAVPGQRPRNGEDGYDVIEWIARQNWSNGKVGMWGHSAVGTVQFQVAVEKPPHLVCAVPASGTLGLPYEQFYYGGVPKHHYQASLGKVGFGKTRSVRLLPRKSMIWKYLENMYAPSKIDIPMLFITSWYDTNPAIKLKTFNRIRVPSKSHFKDMKLMVGPWHHCAFGLERQGELSYPEAKGEVERITLSFFDHFLNGVDNDWSQQPAVTCFDLGSRKWISGADYPPVATSQTILYLTDDERLNQSPSSAAASSRSFHYDPGNPSPTYGGANLDTSEWRSAYFRKLGLLAGPRDQSKIESRKDSLVYTSVPLDSPISTMGSAKVTLYCSTDCTDTDFSARLTDVYPDGRSLLVTDGIKRLSFRDSMSHPVECKPGEVYQLDIEMVPTAITFRKGHRIRLIVSSSNYPRFEASSNVFKYRPFSRVVVEKEKAAINTVYHEAGHPSRLILPVCTN